MIYFDIEYVDVKFIFLVVSSLSPYISYYKLCFGFDLYGDI
jgi:hypothetical protein